MATNVSPSVLANLTAQRARLSAVRQRLNLERPTSQMPGGAPMRELAPSPPGGPAQRPGAQAQAVQGATNIQAAPGQDVANIQLPPEIEQRMLQKIGTFINTYGAQQQGLADRERAAVSAPPATSPAPAAAPAPAGPPPPQQGAPAPEANALAARAVAPIVDFFRANGRLPSMEELRSVSASRLLQQQLGRPPTPDEVRLYLMQPAV